MPESLNKTKFSLESSRILLTGGTGFFGRSILRKLLIDHSLGQSKTSVVVLSRSPKKFLLSYPEFQNLPWLNFYRGDVLEYTSLPADGAFCQILHAATESTIGPTFPALKRYDAIVNGTRNILDYAVKNKVKRILLTSSGGVYGPQPATIKKVPESYLGIPDPLDPMSAYSMGKRAAEHLCSLYSDRFGVESVIARCFSFVGKDLPLNAHFAIGNFIHDALYSDQINVAGDGTPVRSYMNQADLAEWLFCILDRGIAGRAYNVGSNEQISVGDLAYLVRDILSPDKSVVFKRKNDVYQGRNIYIPDLESAKNDLKLEVQISLIESINEFLNE